MSASFFSDQYGNQLYADFNIPTDPEAQRRWLSDYLFRIVSAINTRDVGLYSPVQQITGQQYFADQTNSQISFRPVYRKVIEFGALPDTTTKSVAHGITWNGDNDLVFTRIYGTATDTTARISKPIPQTRTSPPEEIVIEVDDTNVNVITADDETAFDLTYIVLEWTYQER